MLLKAAAILSLLPYAAVAAEAGWSGTLSSLDGGLGGTVKVVDNTTLMISDYKLKDASAPALYWWGSTTDNLPSGFRINNEQVTKPAAGDSNTIKLDAGKTAADFSVVGLWCEKLNANFGQATLTKDGKASSSSDGQKMKGAATSGRSSGYPVAAAGLLVAALCLAL
ncbi:electron transfer DM13 domain-containing protein [Hirsutella rhossiliensis]|uniref:Electron transfer DM13 domain-containing protein n=1 Tax=Hirsutella rhossiliensis TaxID=111463 RepID=A0A9P8MXH0_9HYPO|nr:electron transfer DM13 domain-containing protein [Hirsutella rhossiliensis]KAH0962797.1 electron transfer DM13 domain-containing protein [Hirsutella rhossiliensis]